MSAADLKSGILSLTPKRSKSIDIPGVGTVHLHSMPETLRSEFESIAENTSNKKAIKRLLIAFTARESSDPKSELVFTVEDIKALGGVDSAVVDALATAAVEVVGFSTKDLGTLLGEPEPSSSLTKAG